MVRVEEALKHQGELIQQLIQQMDQRFEQVDLRFEMIERRFEQVDKRFEQMDQRFVELQRRMDRFMFWSLSMTLTVGGIVIAVLKF